MTDCTGLLPEVSSLLGLMELKERPLPMLFSQKVLPLSCPCLRPVRGTTQESSSR